MTHQDLSRQLHCERSELIDSLVRARSVLAYCKGMLEADQLIAAKTLGATFGTTHLEALTRINGILAEPLFGDAPKPAAAEDRPCVTYAHRRSPKGQRYRQFADDQLPRWAVDVQPEVKS